MAANCTDDAFGPWAGSSCRGGFDFTLLFEQSILMIAPTALFVSISVPRLVVLGKRETATLPSPIRTAKLAAAAVFASLQLALLVLQVRLLGRSLGARVSVASAVVNLTASLHILALSWAEDARSVRPSSLIAVYLLLSLLFDLPQARTRWLQGGHSSLAAVFTASVAAKLSLLALESLNKRYYLRNKYRSLPPESTSGILNRSVLWWLNHLFKRGYRSLLPFDALYVLDRALTADALADKVAQAWGQRRRPERRFEYPLVISRALWWPILQFVVPRVVLIGFTFAQPFLISSALNLLLRPPTEVTLDQGYGLIGAAALVYIGLAISTLLFEHRLYRAITMFRGATVLLIHQHTLQIQDGAYDSSAAITLMSSDTDSVIKALETVNEVWARTFEVAVGMYLLARQLGWPCVVPLIAVLVSSGISRFLSSRIGGNQKKWMEAVQKRIALTSSVLSGIKSIKMMGLTRVLTSLIQEARVVETNLMSSFRSNIVWLNVAGNLPEIWGPVLTFAVYAAQASAQGSASLGTTQAFASLAVIVLMARPAGILVSSVVSVAASTGCFDRIQQFLISPVLEDQRLRPSTNRSLSESLAPLAPGSGLELEFIRSTASPKQADSLAVQVDHASIRPASSAETLLRDVRFNVSPNSVTVIVGPVGSGKTTLLKAILGELPCVTGAISVLSRRTAYCCQTAWLPNTTIRQAICGPAGGSQPDEHWYESTVKACALQDDFALLPEGDLTLIGTGSTVLSGGQKQRVALARAVYHRPDLALLDDVLSALDAHTKHLVINNLLGTDGLFRKLGTAVVLVTHDAGALRYADQTLVVSKVEGEQGGTYSRVGPRPASEALAEIRTDPREEDDGQDGEASATTKPSKAASAPAKNPSGNADATRASGEYATYKYYLKSIGLWKSMLLVGFCAASGFFMNFMGIWLKRWSDKNGGQMGFYIGIYVLLSVLCTIALWGYVWTTLCVISPSTGRTLHYKLLRTVMGAPATFFSSTDSGSILNRFSQDMTMIESQLPIGVLLTVSNGFMCLGAAALVFTGSSYMAITMPFLMIALWCLQHVYLRTSRQLRLLDLEAKSPLYSHFLESIKGVGTVRAFGWQVENRAENHRLLDHSQRPYYLLFCVQRWLNLVLDLIVAAMATLVVALAVGLRTNTSPGLLGVSMNSILSFNGMMSSLISGYTQLETSLGSIARLRDFERDVAPEAKQGEDLEPSPNWPDRGRIEFRHVTASHNPEAVALRDISLSLAPGQRVGICGRTGSGKSSLLASLLRLLELDSGDILIDSISLSTLPRETIRERLIVIPQDPLILVGSLRLNLDPSSAHPDAALIAALRRVGLWDDQLSTRGGLGADLAASGLSLGQQQLLALARALLKRERGDGGKGGKVLLLDEPTSNVDGETDRVMQRVLAEDFEGCTILTVAHRLETILGSDVVVVLDAGRVVEVGAPDELMGREDGWFSTLMRSGK